MWPIQLRWRTACFNFDIPIKIKYKQQFVHFPDSYSSIVARFCNFVLLCYSQQQLHLSFKKTVLFLDIMPQSFKALESKWTADGNDAESSCVSHMRSAGT